METPRLTGYLRTFFTAKGKDYDLSKEQVRQLEIIKKRRFDAKETISSSVLSNTAGLSWKYFSVASEVDDEKKSREMRAIFNNYLKRIENLVGEVSSEELKSAALFVYETLSTNATDAEKRHTLTSLLGIVPASTLAELQPMVQTLHDWKSAFDKPDTKQKLKPNETMKPRVEIEFGENIELPLLNFDILESKYILPEAYRPKTKAETKPQEQQPSQAKPKKQKKEAPVSESIISPPDERSYWDDAANSPVDPDWLTNQCSVFIAQEN